MVTYIYFVKCPNCEDEHFDFFDDAKAFAMGCLSQKPIITQTEVCRNDFGECTDHCDLGTVWSWEDMMKDAEPEDTVFSKDETFGISEGLDDFDDFDIGPQIDEFDNSLDFDFEDDSTKTLWVAENLNGGEIVAACWADSEDLAHRLLSQAFRERTGGDLKDCYIREAEADEPDYITDNPNLFAEACERKPIPEGMTIEQLVEEMEENEDTVECTWCNDLFDKSECRYEVGAGGPDDGLGWLCSRCEMAIKSRGETLTFRENNYWDFLDEDLEDTRTLADLVKDSINHLTNDLGKDPWAEGFADEVIGDIERNYETCVPEDMEHYNRWCDAVASEVSRQLNNPDDLTEASLADIMAGVNREHGTNYTERDILDAEGIDDGEFFNDLETQNEITAEAQRRQRQRQIYAINKAKVEREAKLQQLKKEDLDPEELHDLGNEYDGGYPEEQPLLSEIDEVSDSHLKLCPECGEETFDRETGICMTCGFN